MLPGARGYAPLADVAPVSRTSTNTWRQPVLRDGDGAAGLEVGHVGHVAHRARPSTGSVWIVDPLLQDCDDAVEIEDEPVNLAVRSRTAAGSALRDSSWHEAIAQVPAWSEVSSPCDVSRSASRGWSGLTGLPLLAALASMQCRADGPDDRRVAMVQRCSGTESARNLRTPTQCP